LFQPDIAKNSDLALHLASVWTLLANMQKENYMLGLKTILGVNALNADGPPMQSRSEQVQINWIDFPTGPSVEVFKYVTQLNLSSILFFVISSNLLQK